MATPGSSDGRATPPRDEVYERSEDVSDDASPETSRSSQPTPPNGNNEPGKEKLHLLIADLTRMIQESRVTGEKTHENSLCQIRDILENLLHKLIINSLAKTAARLKKAIKALSSTPSYTAVLTGRA